MMDSLSLAATSMNGVLHGEDRPFDGISTDTRSIQNGELFFALQGPNFDGRDYLDTARANGAAGAVVSSAVDDELRSEERRVGKECRSRWSPYH
jgi:UDP-N-acetylmuramyl pentapeptide synthase